MTANPNVAPSASGTLARTPLPHLLVFVMDRKLDGSIVFTSGDGTEHVAVFSQGAPAKVRTPFPVVHLGRLLLEMGVIDSETHDRTLTELAQRGGLHGTILKAAGAISHEQLIAGLREQTMRRMVKLFESLGDEATYSFYKDLNLLDSWGGPELTPLDPLLLLWAGVHVRPNAPHIDTTLSRIDGGLVRVHLGANADRFMFGAPERTYLEVLQAKPCSLIDSVAMGLLPERTAKLLIYVLLITRHVDIEAPESGRKIENNDASAANVTPTGHGAPRGSSGPPLRPNPAYEGGASAHHVTDSAKVAAPVAAPVAPGSRRTDPNTGRNSLGSKMALEREAILARAATIESENFFSVLGISETATPEAIQAAYFGLAKRWHPDRLAKELQDVRDEAAKVFGRVSEAFQTLSDPARRQKYASKAGTNEDDDAKVQRILQATVDFQKADVLMRKRDYAQAEAMAKQAMTGDSEQPEYAALYAWAMAHRPEIMSAKNFAESIAILSEAIAAQPACERAIFYRASLLQMLGRSAAAASDFRKAAQLNPRNIEAARQVRLYNMRNGDEGESIPPKGAASKSDPGKSSVGDVLNKFFKR